MKALQTRSLFVCLLLAVLFSLSGYIERTQASMETIRIKKGPRPEVIAEAGKAKMMPAGFIKRRLRLGIPSITDMVIHDRQYIYITEKWFFDVMEWTENFIALQVPDLDLKHAYPRAYDETFAVLASQIANIAVARRYNVQGSVLIGLLTAKNENPWGEIPADGKDRVYVVGLTENDGILYDIRSKQSIEFSNFPNMHTIRGIMF